MRRNKYDVITKTTTTKKCEKCRKTQLKTATELHSPTNKQFQLHSQRVKYTHFNERFIVEQNERFTIRLGIIYLFFYS